MIHLYTDGSCVPNPGKGGWGCVYVQDGIETLHNCGPGSGNDTNNQMELTAIYQGLICVIDKNIPVTVYSDSQYAINCLTVWYDSWVKKKFKGIKNAELIQVIKQQVNLFSNIKFVWVKGHNKDRYNELADELANKGRML